MNQIILGDCLEKMKDIPDRSIDMILTDLPYGVTQFKWDAPIDLNLLWKELIRITYNESPIVFITNEPFTSILITSNLNMYRYYWIWNKNRAGNFLHSNFQPLRVTEQILVFGKCGSTYNKKGTLRYNPQKTHGEPYSRGKINDVNWNGRNIKCGHIHRNITGERFPKNLININKKNNKSLHPTEKPTELFEYLIKTYTNEGDLVLDCCAGSGITAIACLKTNRRYICIEKDPKYFEIMKNRIDDFVRNQRNEKHCY